MPVAGPDPLQRFGRFNSVRRKLPDNQLRPRLNQFPRGGTRSEIWKLGRHRPIRDAHVFLADLGLTCAVPSHIWRGVSKLGKASGCPVKDDQGLPPLSDKTLSAKWRRIDGEDCYLATSVPSGWTVQIVGAIDDVDDLFIQILCVIAHTFECICGEHEIDDGRSRARIFHHV